MSSVKATARKIGFVLALAGAVLAFGPAAGREPTPAPAPASYNCFPQNTCPPCPGKPVARSQKKEKHEQCACHRVTYQCEDGSSKTCWDNCE